MGAQPMRCRSRPPSRSAAKARRKSSARRAVADGGRASGGGRGRGGAARGRRRTAEGRRRARADGAGGRATALGGPRPGDPGGLRLIGHRAVSHGDGAGSDNRLGGGGPGVVLGGLRPAHRGPGMGTAGAAVGSVVALGLGRLRGGAGRRSRPAAAVLRAVPTAGSVTAARTGSAGRSGGLRRRRAGWRRAPARRRAPRRSAPSRRRPHGSTCPLSGPLASAEPALAHAKAHARNPPTCRPAERGKNVLPVSTFSQLIP